ncbi:dockerin type I domain-containing protein [Lacipirellula parvula]|uniref:Uncharacterized protein n=1 Tax=Lacipirellula parvula TaxID=2650471 RepID=A0A5K7XG59_9BACT|nr:dockerin type I domain-containing protein [Lacipirellula parvula]BBO35810.1 hypothetical protein PLANPX_5422 [Lacipirellula parvula]
MLSHQASPSTKLSGLFAAGLFVVLSSAPAAHAAITWDGQANTQWWFDPVNWNANSNANNVLPPIDPIASGDTQINIGTTGAWNLTGEGVVYDPANDPFFTSASSVTFPTGSPLVSTPGVMRDYGPETIYRLYITRNQTNTNILTIKSGDLVIESTTIIGRSGSTAEAANLGKIVQTGGSLRLPTATLDLGQRETSGWGNGTYDYRGGVLEVQQAGGTQGIRLSAGSSTNGTGGKGRFIMHNPSTAGHVRTFDFTLAADGNNGDGITTGVATVEFHFENGGTRPIQVDRNLTINNGLDADSIGTRSSRLELVLDSAPMLTAGVPQNLGLFDVNFGGTFSGIINGTGDLDGDAVFNDDRVFSNAAGSVHYRQGDTVSATFGNTKYNWTISYTGDITWTDPVAGSVAAVAGSGGTDVVLVGLSSETLAVDDADFNNDGTVDGKDFLIWQRGFGSGTNNGTGDANGNGAVDAADLTIWKSQFGGPAPGVAAVSAIPEPATMALAFVAMCGLLAVRRRTA